MSRFSDGDPGYLRTEQYRDGSNLSARLELHARYSTNAYGWHRWLFDQLDLEPDARVLDVGCGTAALWRKNRDRIPADWEITLSDFSPGMLANAAAALDPTRFSFRQFDVQSIPFADDLFDAVLACHMLYHVPDRDGALGEIRRVLKPGGMLFASTNGVGHLRELNDLVERFAGAPRHDLEFADRFGFESGRELISRHFCEVQLLEYDDGLEVADADLLICFIRASWSESDVPRDAERTIRAHVEARISSTGTFPISKRAGIFAARII